MDAEYRRAFAALNQQQKKAVETIDGPVLVIAGPGTGKTQLLAMRAAHILQTDNTMLPSNILCLTFTNSAANNMLERLIQLIGQDAYQVAIHTFNSFGAYVMNAYSDYFYQWREAKTADELTTHSILQAILATLPGNHQLALHSSDGIFYAQTPVRNLIGDAKRADLSPSDLRQVLNYNRQTYELVTPVFRSLWPERISAKNALKKIDSLMRKLEKIKVPESQVEIIAPLKQMMSDSLKKAAEESAQMASGKTRPFTAWKNQWLERDEQNQLVFTGARHIDRLLEATKIYQQYQAELNRQGLADFNDQIMWVIAAMKAHPELRYNLQERFQYIMVDELQDTNRSQLLMTHYLTDAPVHEGRPNILAVGDDDQAIYRFQGADVGNVSLFEKLYRKPVLISLALNYRSNQAILTSSRNVRRQINLSLEKAKAIRKKLEATVAKLGQGVSLNEFENQAEHYSYIADEIKKLLKQSKEAKEIAVLARERVQLDALVPYMQAQKIPINYERRENVFTQPQIINLINMMRLIDRLSRSELEKANELFAKVLAQPMWELKPVEIWRLASEAHAKGLLWLDVIARQKNRRANKIADFFIGLGLAGTTMPLEQVVNELLGSDALGPQDEKEEEPTLKPKSYFSPFKRYYFGQQIQAGNPGQYLRLLSQLSTLLRHLRKSQADARRTLFLKDALELVDTYQRGGVVMLDQDQLIEDSEAVFLMTVHKAKGLEFDTVFLIGLQNDVWTTSTTRGRLSYPANLKPIRPSDNQDDDSLRLLYVAMTRARQSLYLNYFRRDEDGAPKQIYAPLLAIDVRPKRPKVQKTSAALVRQFEQRLRPQTEILKTKDMAAFFEAQLKKYKLSVTHLNNFLDISQGGPAYFFEHNLAHFPAAKAPIVIYGRLMHAALSRAHDQALTGRRLSRSSIRKNFIKDIEAAALSSQDKDYFADRGANALEVFLGQMRGHFRQNQRVDFNFASQGVSLGDAKLKGSVDLLDLDETSKQITVSDYKVGRPLGRWQLPPSAEAVQRIRLHRYRNQLLFYKILVDGARDFGQRGWQTNKGIIVYVEPQRGRIRSLELSYNEAEVDRFKRLILAVWAKIQKLDLPDTSHYEPTLKGIMVFEDDLIKGI